MQDGLVEEELKDKVSTMIDEIKTFRIEFLQTLLPCGIPVNKVDDRLCSCIDANLEG
jgi:hypothetical protein